MELEDSALVTDTHLESSMRRLREEERMLLEQQAAMEAAGNVDDIAALEHQDLLRLNQVRTILFHKVYHVLYAMRMPLFLNINLLCESFSFRYIVLKFYNKKLVRLWGYSINAIHITIISKLRIIVITSDIQLRQQELLKQQARRERSSVVAAVGAGACSGGGAGASGALASLDARRSEIRRRTCNVRVNQLHAATAAEALETDVWPTGELLNTNLINVSIIFASFYFAGLTESLLFDYPVG